MPLAPKRAQQQLPTPTGAGRAGLELARRASKGRRAAGGALPRARAGGGTRAARGAESLSGKSWATSTPAQPRRGTRPRQSRLFRARQQRLGSWARARPARLQPAPPALGCPARQRARAAGARGHWAHELVCRQVNLARQVEASHGDPLQQLGGARHPVAHEEPVHGRHGLVHDRGGEAERPAACLRKKGRERSPKVSQDRSRIARSARPTPAAPWATRTHVASGRSAARGAGGNRRGAAFNMCWRFGPRAWLAFLTSRLGRMREGGRAGTPGAKQLQRAARVSWARRAQQGSRRNAAAGAGSQEARPGSIASDSDRFVAFRASQAAQSRASGLTVYIHSTMDRRYSAVRLSWRAERK